MALRGKLIDAPEAEAIGLIHEACETVEGAVCRRKRACWGGWLVVMIIASAIVASNSHTHARASRDEHSPRHACPRVCTHIILDRAPAN